MKLSKEDFINSAFIFECDYIDGVDCWDSAAHGLLFAYRDDLCPNYSDNIQDYVSFDYDAEYPSMVEDVVEKLILSYDNDEDAMLEDFQVNY